MEPLIIDFAPKVFPRSFFIFNGVAYTWSGWFGCQLESYEWRRVPAGTRRVLNFLNGRATEITVWKTERIGLRIRTSWTIQLNGTLDEQNAQIRKLKSDLAGLV